MSKPNNVLYAQAGGVTAVINTSAAGVIETIKKHPNTFGKLFAARNGIKGILQEDFFDITNMPTDTIARLKYQPGAAFEACRFDLDTLEQNPGQYARMLAIFKAYDIGYFFYNGGNGSMVTAQKVADYCIENGHVIACIGIAKTIDNDLAMSHCSPGFGSAAKYIATSLLEATMDCHAMHNTSTKFFALEAMGRNTGWLAIAGGLIKQQIPNVPLIILPAERAFNKARFLEKITQNLAQHDYCICVVSEGLMDEEGQYVSIEGIEKTKHQSYVQLGGVAHTLSKLVADTFHCKTHSAVPDYLQRSASHLVSEVDWRLAYDAGKACVEAAVRGEHGVLPTVKRVNNSPLTWTFETVPLVEVANLEKKVPAHFLTEDGMDITAEAMDYLLPLIQGERSPPFVNGLPAISPLCFSALPKKLAPYTATQGG